MALTLFEDTFVTVARASTLLSGDPDWSQSSVLEKEQALRDATNELNDLLWRSAAVSGAQSLSWPRKQFSFFDPSYNLEVAVPEGEVPLRLQRATANLAAHYRKYPSAVDNYSASFEKIKLGPLELDDTNTTNHIPKVPYQSVVAVIEPLLANTNSNGWWRAN